MCNPDQEHEGDEDSFFFLFFSLPLMSYQSAADGLG